MPIKRKLTKVEPEMDLRGWAQVVFVFSTGERHAVFTVPHTMPEDIGNPGGYMTQPDAEAMVKHMAELANMAVELSR